jgi:hypothetical protein
MGIRNRLLCNRAALSGQVPNPHAGEPIGTVQQVYDGALMPDMVVSTFRNIERLFPTRVVRKGSHVHPLPASERQLTNVQFTSNGFNTTSTTTSPSIGSLVCSS